MIPIIDFCWRDFALEQVRNITVAQMHNLAQQRQPELFLFHDPAYRWSALIIPELVLDIVPRFDLPPQESASAIGFLDLLEQDQMIVHQNQPASLVATLSAWQQAQAIIAVDDNSVPVGLFIANVVAAGLLERSQILHQSTAQLKQTVARLTAIGDVAGAIAAIEGEHDHFHSEHRMAQSRDPYVCEDHGKPHFRSRCPCSIHPDARCSKRRVAST